MIGMKKGRYSISAFFPIYNDECTVKKMVMDALSVLRTITDDYEIILVDDCSIDKSGRIADSLAKKYRQVRVMHHRKNRGYGGALKTGITSARKDLIFYTDGDAQYDARELAKLYPLIGNADVVNGYKIKRHDVLYRIVLGRLYNAFVKVMFHMKIRDIDCDFRLFRRRVFKDITLESNSGVICVEMMKKIQLTGARIAEVPVHHYERVGGVSQFFKVMKISSVFLGLAKQWWKLMVVRKLQELAG